MIDVPSLIQFPSMQDADEQVVEDGELRMDHEMASFTLARLPGLHSNQVIVEMEDQ